MSQYYGSMDSGKAEVTRQGTKSSGITARVNGWNTGVRVVIHWNDEAQCDEVFVIKTSGSNGRFPDETIARWLDGSEVQLTL